MTAAHTRRYFLKRAGAYGLGFYALRSMVRASESSASAGVASRDKYGPLVSDPAGVLDLPDRFRYSTFSHVGEEMADGLLVPGKHDGMAAFRGPDDLTILVRNHEMELGNTGSPWGTDGGRIERVDRSLLYDAGKSRGASRGGTTTVVYDTKGGRDAGEAVRTYMSLGGTERNCAGGPTPQGTWLSCEETVQDAGRNHQKRHGYVFEVPADVASGLCKPAPIVGMGRFNHEAVAIDPMTGIVYLTEDRHDGLLYRFIPNERNRYHEGGRLQALVVKGRPALGTENWDKSPTVRVGDTLGVTWLDVEDADSPDDSLRKQGYERGAARFARGEGMWYGRGAIYFACTSGGRAQQGQIWRLTPARPPSIAMRPAQLAAMTGDELELFVEPNDVTVINNADNITVAPWGDLIVCEDGDGAQFLVGIEPDGTVYPLARNAMNGSELAGATFSPDGSTLFVNIQNPGLTVAIRRAEGGRWH